MATNSRPGPADASSVAAFLADADLFRDLEPVVRDRLAIEWESLHVQGGDLLIRAGDVGDAVYLLVSGRLRVTVDGPDGPVVIAEVGRGQVVGEMALLDQAPRNAAVVAVRDSEVLRLSAERFRTVIEEEPAILRGVTRLLLDRLRLSTANASPRSTVRTLTVVGASDSTEVTAFARGLAAALGTPAAPVVDDHAIDERFGPAAAQHGSGFTGEVLDWLHRLEREHRHVIYLARAATGPWAQRCLRQADRVVLVADADAGAPVGHRALRAVGRAVNAVPVDLVILHPADRVRPRRTAQWLGDGTAVASHHHVRQGRREDHERLARLLTGRGVGLTLGGGGPRGFAHVGAFRAIREAGLPIDHVGGTSIGSIMGGFLALGWDQDTLEARVLEGFVSSGRVIDRTLPMVSLSSARKLEGLLRDDRFFGDTDIEDLWLPYFAVSANLTRAEVVIDERGPVWRAIRSSISLPGVLPPVCRDGELLVDGGLMNNLPIDVMAERIGDGVHVAIDLEPTVDLRVPHPFPSAISGWSVAGHRLNPLRRSRRIPGPLEVLLRSRAVSSRMMLREKLDAVPVDLYLSPPVSGCDPLDFTIAPELIERGYRYTLDQLEQAEGRLDAMLVGAREPLS